MAKLLGLGPDFGVLAQRVYPSQRLKSEANPHPTPLAQFAPRNPATGLHRKVWLQNVTRRKRQQKRATNMSENMCEAILLFICRKQKVVVKAKRKSTFPAESFDKARLNAAWGMPGAGASTVSLLTASSGVCHIQLFPHYKSPHFKGLAALFSEPPLTLISGRMSLEVAARTSVDGGTSLVATRGLH